MLDIRIPKTVFDVPRLFFTLGESNPKSKKVINELNQLLDGMPTNIRPEIQIFSNAGEIVERFEKGISPNSAVVILDSALGTKHFRPTTSTRAEEKGLPLWTNGAKWVVRVNYSLDNHILRCAHQTRADFLRRFKSQLAEGKFPWGDPKKGELPPVNVEFPENADSIIHKLNNGPNLADAIADKEFALELPKGSRISWIRVAAEPIKCKEENLFKALKALRSFEKTCQELVNLKIDEIRPLLFAGVTLEKNPRLLDNYLFPSVNCFSVDRADLHWNGQGGIFASEIDEMPGGFPELPHIDNVYGLNEQRWKKCFQWLTSKGPLLFLVSHDWSRCYIPETEWLVQHLKSKGYPAHFLTTDRLDELTINQQGVYFQGSQVGTIWRQFPIFETRGKLAELVFAAKEEKVRMVPEFAHFGNKSWFSIFRSHTDFFQNILDPETFEILDKILPDSHLVISEKSFPFDVAGVFIQDLEGLRSASEKIRNMLVLKVSGANTLAARSYGVLIGHGLTEETWRSWINERIKLKQPFIVQQRLESGVARVAVKNTKRNCPEVFDCRIMLRPWMVDGELVSVNVIAVPRNTLRVHGMVDMAVLPVVLE